MIGRVLEAKRHLKHKHGLLDMDRLCYIGYTDLGGGAKLLYLNVNQPGHLKHKSTLGYKIGDKSDDR